MAMNRDSSSQLIRFLPLLAHLARFGRFARGRFVLAPRLAQGLDLPGNMMPFALRNVALLGVDSVHAPMALREQAWQRLAESVDLAKLEAMAVEIDFDKLPEAAGQILQGQIRGRAVVNIAAS